MPIFLSEEEFRLLANDAAVVAERADAFICDLRQQLDVVRAEADSKAIAEEQNCALLEQRYTSLYSEFSRVQYENAQLSASNEKSRSELADAQTEKHQLHIKLIGKDGEVERLSLEAAELHKSVRQLMGLVEQKDAEISERNSTIQSYIEKIVHLSENNSSTDAKLHEMEAELRRCQANCSRLTQEKELLEKQNAWLDEELTTKSNSLFELRRRHMDDEADMSGKMLDLERQVKELSNSLNNSRERVKELELRVKSLEMDLCSSKDVAAANETHFITELSTVNKLVELYKASSDEWSKKAGELEGVIKALETHLAQVEDDYKEKLDNETSLRTEFQKEVTDLKIKLEKCEEELENTRKASESNLLPWSTLPGDSHVKDLAIYGSGCDISQMLVPRIATGVSGTALAASLLRDGWSLTKMYEKYQETSDALRHEKWGRKHAEAVLERVLHEIEDKAQMVLEERVEHERMVEAYAKMDEKLLQARIEHDSFENSLRKLKAELRRKEREYSSAQKEINDLQKQVTVLLKECQDIQLRCGGSSHLHVEDTFATLSTISDDSLNSSKSVSEHLLTFKDINELVEQNVKLRSFVHRLSTDDDKKEAELRESFEIELQRVADAAASKVEAALTRSEEQASMIESLHNSVAMYKRLYEEEHKVRSSTLISPTTVSDDGKKELLLLFEGSQEVSKKAYEQLCCRARILEEDVAKLNTELISARAERDKMSLEASFAKERLDSFMKEFEAQRVENNAVLVRNMELTHLLVDYQKKVRESSDSLQASAENSRKLSMEVSILKHEREIFVSSEKKMSDELQSQMERVHRLQSSLDAIQTAEEVRESARATERRNQDDYLKRLEKDWAEAQRDLQKERDLVRVLTVEKERTIETSMNQVEDIRKELANAWHAVAVAESKAAVAEARCTDLDEKIKNSGKQAITEFTNHEQSAVSVSEISEDLWKTKEELEKVKDEANACKEYMLQYKGMAHTNEIALKQMELAHEDYKSEAVKMKSVLEDQVQFLQNQISELERKYMLKCEEVNSITEAKEIALSSAMSDISSLRIDVADKMKRVGELEVQVSYLKDDLDKEQKRWRIAQDNYERQIILQSETIQELTNTSKELALKQSEVSRLRELLDAQKAENDYLKSSWETEKLNMLQMKNESEKMRNELDEQNKVLHNRLEALHDRLAEKDQNSVGPLSVSAQEDRDLQKVVSFLRRSKEIAETEITLLKQEKLRLQSKVEGALKAYDSAQALLHSQLENSRELLLKDDEFKSLQIQVREINLLRESNIQLREENKHNFEECQKLRQLVQKARVEAENFETCLKQKQTEIEAFQKEIELQKIEISNLNNRNAEILQSCKDINIDDFEQLKDELKQIKNTLAKKVESIMILEQDLMNSHEELSEREKKLNDAQNIEANLKVELDKQTRQLLMSKNKNKSLVKEKDELNLKNELLTKEVGELRLVNQATVKEKEELNFRNQVLTKEKEDAYTKTQISAREKDEFTSKVQALTKEKEELNLKNQVFLKQIEDFKSGRKVSGENEQAKKEREKDARIQMLEKSLERMREDQRNVRQTKKKTEMAMLDLANRINTDKQKVEDELQKHKSAVSIVLEKTGVLSSQLPSASSLDERTAAYFQSVSSFEAAATSFDDTSDANLDIPAPSVQAVPTPATKLPTKPTPKTAEEREKAPISAKTNVEIRRPGRRFVRPSLEKPEGTTTTDTETTGMDVSSTAEGKTSLPLETRPSIDVSLAPPAGTRKRLAPPESEVLGGSSQPDEANVASAPPPSKSAKEAEFSEAEPPFKRAKESGLSEAEPPSLKPSESELSEAYLVISRSSENSELAPLDGTTVSEASEMEISHSKDESDPTDKLPSTSNEEYLEVVKEDEGSGPANDEAEEQQEYIDAAVPDEAQFGGDAVTEVLSDVVCTPVDESPGEPPKDDEIKEIPDSATRGEEGEDGELMLDETEQQPNDDASEEGQIASITGDGAGSGDETEDAIEFTSSSAHDPANATETDGEEVAEDSDKHNSSSVDQTAPTTEISAAAHDESQSSIPQNTGSGQPTQNAPAETGESQAGRSSRTISLTEVARQNAPLRQERLAARQLPPVRGRRPPARGESGRGRGQGGGRG